MSFYHRPHRVLLLDNSNDPSSLHAGNGSKSHEKFDTNMVIILAVLLCALIFALGINSIVRCILRCANRGPPPTAAEGGGGGTYRRHQKGLNKSELREIRVLVYGSDRGGAVGSTECPICLSEFVGGEKIRVLPKCAHCFHVRCVDVWLGSNSSCPTCRRSVVDEPAAEVGGGGDVIAEEVG